MKIRDYVYIICMVFFFALAYLLFDRGFNVKTKTLVNYQKDSDISYRVYLHENDEYQGNYQKMNERYLTELVDNIKFDFLYKKLFNKEVTGYYTYSVIGVLHAYADDITDDVWTKEYKILDNNTIVLNQGNEKVIDINDRATIDFNKCKNDLDNFIKKYNIALQGYLKVNFIINEELNFKGIDKVVSDEAKIEAIIPLSYDTFKINIKNDNHNIDSYYDFSTREKVNYFLLILAAFSLSLGISFLALVIREMVYATDDKTKYVRELKKILSTYDDKIVKVKRFYNKKKYNLIYVDSFLELLDVYNEVGNPISYREVKKDEEAIFIIVDEDNAWIYQMSAKNK